MALLTQKGKAGIPSDAVILTESEAFDYQKNIISLWKYPKDVFWVNYGPATLSISTFATTLYSMNYYRHKLRLGSIGRVASYLPVVVIPTLLAGLAHEQGVQRRIILNQFTCPMCIETRAAALQFSVSTLYPCSFAPVAAFMLASRFHTYNVPLLTVDPKNVFNLYLKFTKPALNIFIALGIFNALLAVFVTYQEAQSISKVTEKLLTFEKNLIKN